MRYFLFGLTIIIVTLFFAPQGILAQEYSDTGYAVYFPVSQEVIELADGRVNVETTNNGYILAEDTESPFHLVAQSCSGTNVIGADGIVQRSAGHCAGRDNDGDMYWLSFWNTADGGEWTLFGGTGKFEGISGGGTVQIIAQDVGGSFVITWSGTWRVP
jgi:hypothetical protein